MTARLSLTDGALKAMLGRRASRARPEGLQGSIMAGVGVTSQQRRSWVPRPSWPVVGLAAHRPVWLVALIALLLALAAIAAIAGSHLFEPKRELEAGPSKLVPSGIDLMSGDLGHYSQAVADRDGFVWAAGAGRLVRYDPGTGSARDWSITDDRRFDARSIMAARDGGIWIVGDRTLTRFDGATFRETFDTGFAVKAATESHDGSLWVATAEGAVLRLVDSSRTLIAAPQPDPKATVSAIAVDGTDAMWLAWDRYPDPSLVSRYDGAAWRMFDERDAAPLADNVTVFAVSPDGSIWMGSEAGLARFDGSTWTEWDALNDWGLDCCAFTSLTVGQDGELWAAARTRDRGPTMVARFDELAPTVVTGWIGENDAIVRVADRLFSASSAGLYEHRNGRWNHVWPVDQPTVPTPFWGGAAPSLIAITGNEVWQDYWYQTWHYLDDTWSAVTLGGADITAPLVSGDGTLWPCRLGRAFLAGESSAMVVEATEKTACTRTADGTGLLLVMGGDEATGSPGWTVRRFAVGAAGWTEVDHTPPTELIVEPSTVAVSGDGTIWVGGQGAWGFKPGLVRLVGGSWEQVWPRGDAEFIVEDLIVTRDGEVWLAAQDLSPSPETRPFGDSWVARFDGASWTVFDSGDVFPFADSLAQANALIWDLSAAPDGTIWAATDLGLARYDAATGWTTRGPSAWYGAVSVASDGTVWASGTEGIVRIRSWSAQE